jgi:hypothetical protein
MGIKWTHGNSVTTQSYEHLWIMETLITCAAKQRMPFPTRQKEQGINWAKSGGNRLPDAAFDTRAESPLVRPP